MEKLKNNIDMFSENKVNVFISYSWDDEKHKKWVFKLADLINSKGGNSIIDTHLRYGGHLKLFMERTIRASDVVLMIFTPNYKLKADLLSGGVGFEYNIINRNLFEVISSNEKYIGVLRVGDHLTSVPAFLGDFKYVDLRIGKKYSSNLKELIKQILNTPMKQPIKNKTGPSEDVQYRDLEKLLPELKEKVKYYFTEIFKLDVKNNEDFVNDLRKLSVKNEFTEWEDEIYEYHEEIQKKFSQKELNKYDDRPDDFKYGVFDEVLWTVKAALRTKDPDLARYKRDYADAMGDEILDTVKKVLDETKSYIKKVGNKIDFEKLKDINSLKMDYLEAEDMLMKKIIGYGIRSEILHRYFPSNFPIMTQKSLWALYFMGDKTREFTTIEQRTRKGIMRVSHNWQYPYERFTFIINELTLELEKLFIKHKCIFKRDIRFGYINVFLSAINDYHKNDIKELHQWERVK